MLYNKTVSINPETAKQIDELIEKRQFRSFSDFMREAAADKLRELNKIQ